MNHVNSTKNNKTLELELDELATRVKLGERGNRNGRRYPREIKIQVVRMFRSGLPVDMIVKKTGFCKATIFSWNHQLSVDKLTEQASVTEGVRELKLVRETKQEKTSELGQAVIRLTNGIRIEIPLQNLNAGLIAQLSGVVG